jgi:6,7-dimethyl-8-ribityllumazine synthase
MASALKNLSEYNETNIPSAADMIFGIAVSDWNADITHSLYNACYETLTKHGAKEENIHTVHVPGTFELPTAAKLLASSKKLSAVICIGAVIKGETKHDEYINHAVATGLTALSVGSGIPCVFGVLTPNTHQQAVDRSGGKYGNKGVEAAVTAIRMAALKKELTQPSSRIGF